MKSTGIVRRLDELGRITLPIELRRNFDVNERDPLEIFVDDDKIILKKYNPADIFTGEDMDDLIDYKGKKVSRKSIIELAKQRNSNGFQDALKTYMSEHQHLQHGIDQIDTLFPEFTNLNPGAPELLTRDQGFVDHVINGAHKTPFSRIRTRKADARKAEIRAKGYKKGSQKTKIGNINLLTRTTDPQTVYVKDELERDDIVDITDFDVVEYQYGVMNMALKEEVALAVLIGDGRETGDAHKISEEHIRPIWLDDEDFMMK